MEKYLAYESKKIKFAEKRRTCHECWRSIDYGDLISIGIRQFNVGAPVDLSGRNIVHYKCYWKIRENAN